MATSLRISGFTFEEMVDNTVDGPKFEGQQLQKYQYPNAEKTLSDTVNSLATEDFQHPPLYFVLLRLWVKLWGPSLTSLRSLSALFSILILPAAFWLCRELFRSPAVGWVAMALIAVSPVQVIYAQEARQYSLWMLLTLVSSAVLLRALRLGGQGRWGLYSLSLALGLYTHLFFTLIALGHGLHILFVEGFKLTHRLRSYLLASVLALVAYSPWIAVILARATDPSGVSWMDESSSLTQFSIRLLGVLSRTFVDFGAGPAAPAYIKLLAAPFILFGLGVSLAAFYALIRQTTFRIWFWLVTLTGTTGTAILLSYLILGKQMATTRLMLPVTLGLHLTVAYFLVQLQTSQFGHGRRLSRGIGATLLSIGILSCVLRLNTPVWWNQLPDINEDTPAIAKLINRQDEPLIILDTTTGITKNLVTLQSLLHFVEADVDVRVVDRKIPAEIARARHQDIFIYIPVDSHIESQAELQIALAEKYDAKLEPVYDSLWRIAL
ncbi:MAG: hypothetical protein F6J97_15410 [Leptolyngbya sp. SIO4C1]|nr:hypothetical protein [Leptolyngbya sp. SIO4C1]